MTLNLFSQPILEKSKIDETERDSRPEGEEKKEEPVEPSGPFSTDTMLEKIVSFMRDKMRNIGHEMIESDVKMAAIEGQDREIARMNALADLVELRGGVKQRKLHSNFCLSC